MTNKSIVRSTSVRGFKAKTYVTQSIEAKSSVIGFCVMVLYPASVIPEISKMDWPGGFAVVRQTENYMLTQQWFSIKFETLGRCLEAVGFDRMPSPYKEPHVCPVCGSQDTYETLAVHCNRCAVNTEI